MRKTGSDRPAIAFTIVGRSAALRHATPHRQRVSAPPCWSLAPPRGNGSIVAQPRELRHGADDGDARGVGPWLLRNGYSRFFVSEEFSSDGLDDSRARNTMRLASNYARLFFSSVRIVLKNRVKLRVIILEEKRKLRLNHLFRRCYFCFNVYSIFN